MKLTTTKGLRFQSKFEFKIEDKAKAEGQKTLKIEIHDFIQNFIKKMHVNRSKIALNFKCLV